MQRAWVLLLVFTLGVPFAVFADHKKHFKEGQKAEAARQWDKAAQEYALAASEKPDSYEYVAYYSRALVNAAFQLVERGDKLADQKDFNAAYQAYRQAYAYDPGNELALIKARRMLEAQGLPTNDLPTTNDKAGPQYKPQDDDNPNTKASYTSKVVLPSGKNTVTRAVNVPTTGSRKFQPTNVILRDAGLLSTIEQIAQSMNLNVIFDQQVAAQYRNQRIQSLELRNVTYPKALEMILKTNNLMYSQQDTRTIVVAMDGLQSRMKYEPYAVRTFYIKYADVDQVKNALSSALQTKSATPIKQLNALVVRDTPANLEMIERMISSLDKAKAEVLIDVSIYEVSRNDLTAFGNQFGNADKNGNQIPFFGGFGQNGDTPFRPNTHILLNSNVLGFALGLAPSQISFFQSRGKAKLLASTQVHILDGEQQSIKIGRRIPIQTASLPSYTQPNTGRNGTNVNNLDSSFINAFGVGIPQIQYENVGLNIDMKPQVFEDEVQMQMKIESSSVDSSTSTLTPIFSQRQLSSFARVKDGQPTLIAGVSQNEESKTVKGIPVIGLIPILGRFFSTPDTKNSQNDVVITVTPHVLRRADIKEDDHFAINSGYAQDPSAQLSIQQIIDLADMIDAQQSQVAGSPTTPQMQPSQPITNTTPASQQGNLNQPGVVVSPVNNVSPNQPPALKPNVQAKPLDKVPPANDKGGNLNDDDDDDDDADTPQAGQAAGSSDQSPITVTVRSAGTLATRGQDLYVAINLSGNSTISSANLSLNFDPNILEVKSVRDGGLLRSGSGTPDIQFTADNGVLNVQMSRQGATAGVPARGMLLLLIFNVKGQGQSPLQLNEAQTFIRTGSGQVASLKFQSTQVEVR
ncbi:MAG: secretin N-terminal domain-containing protein [Acidobacteriota bacterium]